MAESLENQNSTEPVASQPPGVNAATVFYKLATFVLVIIVLHYGAPILIPFALAILLALILAPITKHLDRLRLGRPASILIILVLGLSLFGTLGWDAEHEMAQMVEAGPNVVSACTISAAVFHIGTTNSKTIRPTSVVHCPGKPGRRCFIDTRFEQTIRYAICIACAKFGARIPSAIFRTILYACYRDRARPDDSSLYAAQF